MEEQWPAFYSQQSMVASCTSLHGYNGANGQDRNEVTQPKISALNGWLLPAEL
jgi:hypothetical protein